MTTLYFDANLRQEEAPMLPRLPVDTFRQPDVDTVVARDVERIITFRRMPDPLSYRARYTVGGVTVYAKVRKWQVVSKTADDDFQARWYDWIAIDDNNYHEIDWYLEGCVHPLIHDPKLSGFVFHE